MVYVPAITWADTPELVVGLAVAMAGPASLVMELCGCSPSPPPTRAPHFHTFKFTHHRKDYVHMDMHAHSLTLGRVRTGTYMLMHLSCTCVCPCMCMSLSVYLRIFIFVLFSCQSIARVQQVCGVGRQDTTTLLTTRHVSSIFSGKAHKRSLGAVCVGDACVCCFSV